MSTFLRNKAISKTTPLRKENPFLQIQCCFPRTPRDQALLNTQQHCFQGKGEREEPVQLRCLEKCCPSIQFSQQFCQRLCTRWFAFSQEYLQGQNKNMLIKSTLQKLFWAQSFTPDHLLIEKQDLIYVFCSTLFKTVRFRNSRTRRANCYIFSCSSGMEGSENVKSNLPFSEESEQDLYDTSLRRKGVRTVYLGT